MKRIYIIGDNVKFILSEKCLVRLDNDTKVKLRASAAFCLLLMLENHGKLVTHDDLYKFGWERFGMTASLNVLHNTIFYLRKMLNQAGDFDNGIIETIHRRGFIFNLQVAVALTYINMDTPEEEETIQAEEHDQNSDEAEDFLFSAESEMAEQQNSDAPRALTGKDTPQETRPAPRQGDETESVKAKSEMKSSSETFSSPGLIQPEVVAINYSASVRTSDNLSGPAVNRKRAVTFPWPRYILLLSILLVVACSLIIFSSVSPGNYVNTGKLGACEVYQNNRAYDFKNLKMVDHLSRFCKEPRVLYLTNYPYSNKVSAINCREKISLFSDDICYSNYFIYKDTGYHHD
jgi:DNA-binding winged helix-turn-helix (wHTH) protein